MQIDGKGVGYRIACVRALNFRVSGPEIWQKQVFRDFLGSFGFSNISGLWKMAIPCATKPWGQNNKDKLFEALTL